MLSGWLIHTAQLKEKGVCIKMVSEALIRIWLRNKRWGKLRENNLAHLIPREERIKERRKDSYFKRINITIGEDLLWDCKKYIPKKKLSSTICELLYEYIEKIEKERQM